MTAAAPGRPVLAGPPAVADDPAAPGAAKPGGRSGRLNVPVADGFRGLAALAVLVYHLYYVWGPKRLDHTVVGSLALAGYMGVDVFFVLSGFLLFLPVVRSGTFGSVRGYALRRAARILPAYYLALTLIVALYPLIANHPSPLRSTTGRLSLLLHMTFLQHSVGLMLGWAEGFGMNSVMWTLALEVTFYILLPLVATRYARHPFLWLAGALLVTAAWRVADAHTAIPLPHLPGLASLYLYHSFVVTEFPNYAGTFAMGMTAAWVFVRLREVRLPRWLPVVVAPAALAVMLYKIAATGARDQRSFPISHWTGTSLVAATFTILLLAVALGPRWVQWPLTNHAVKWLGDVSYGLYLLHLIVLSFIYSVLHWLPGGVSMFLRVLVVGFGTSVVAGSLSFVLLERPVIRWARRRSRQLAARAGAGRNRARGWLVAGPAEPPARRGHAERL